MNAAALAINAPTAETAHDLFAFIRRRLAPFQRIRIIEFGPLPKTISGKIRRVELRARTPGEEFRSGYGWSERETEAFDRR
jgi:acyl-coenzyme A synthetase/AMP-(fatty) acid ligase